MGQDDRGATVVEAQLSFSEIRELMNAVHHYRIFGRSSHTSSAILDAGFNELVDAMARAVIDHPEEGRKSLEILRLTSPSPEEAEEALRVLEESVEKAARERPQAPEPKTEQERLERKEKFERMSTRPVKMVLERVEELRREDHGDDDERPGHGQGAR